VGELGTAGRRIWFARGRTSLWICLGGGGLGLAWPEIIWEGEEGWDGAAPGLTVGFCFGPQAGHEGPHDKNEVIRCRNYEWMNGMNWHCIRWDAGGTNVKRPICVKLSNSARHARSVLPISLLLPDCLPPLPPRTVDVSTVLPEPFLEITL